MKQIRTLAVVVLLLGMAFGQNKVRDQNTLLFTVTGVTLPMLDSIGTQYNQWELVMTGGPATLTVTIAGCMRGGTCSATLATSSGTANQILNTTGVYDYYNVAAAWTGGTSPTVTVNRTATIALNGGGGSSVTGTLSTNKVAKGTAAHVIGDSLCTEDGTTFTCTDTGGASFVSVTTTGTATQDRFTEMAAPATPNAGFGYAWFDLTNHRFNECNSSATCGTTVVAITAPANQFFNSVTAAGGVIGSAQPAIGGISGLGTGVATFLGTPSSANFFAATTDETGSGLIVGATSPVLTTPNIGVATATSVNKMAITAPATSSALAVADGKTFTANNTITLAGTDAQTYTFPTTTATMARTDAAQSFTGLQTFNAGANSTKFGTNSNCSSSAGTCVAASSGSVSIAAAATTVTVTTTQMTTNSAVLITEDSSLGTKLSVTCNTTTGRTYTVTARTNATSFVITASAAPATNPACLSFLIIN